MAGTVTRIVIDRSYCTSHWQIRHCSCAWVPSSMRLMILVLCVFLHTMTVVRSLYDVPLSRLSVRHHHPVIDVILRSVLQQ